MANINLIEKPQTFQINYYDNSVQNGSVELSLDPSDTPVYFKFSSDIIGVDTNTFFSIWVNNDVSLAAKAINAGDWIQIKGVRFTASANPAQNEFFTCGTTLNIGDRFQCVYSLVQAINSNQDLNWRYTAELKTFPNDKYVIFMFAIYPGAVYSVQAGVDAFAFLTGWPAPFNNGSTISFGINVPGTDSNRGQLLQNYQYGCYIELWTYKNNPNLGWGRKDSLGLLGRIIAPPLAQKWNASNEFIFDISQFINTLVSNEFPDDIVNISSDVVYVPSAITNYLVKWGEQFNGGYDFTTQLPVNSSDNITNVYVRQYQIGQSEIRWTAQGAFQLAQNFPVWSQYWNQVIKSNFNPLTNDYQAIIITTEQPLYKLMRRTTLGLFYPELVYFYFLNDQLSGINKQIKLRTKFHYIDGTTSINFFTHQKTISESGLYYIDCSLTQIGLYSNELSSNKRVKWVENQLICQRNNFNTVLSENFNYEIDLKYEPDLYLKLWWRNKFGNFDNFEFEGLQKMNLDIKSINFTKSLTTKSGYNRDKHINSIYTQQSTQIYTINTGWVDENHYLWIQSLLESNEVWTQNSYIFNDGVSIITDKESTIAVNIISQKYEIDAINQKLYNLEITFSISINDNNIRT